MPYILQPDEDERVLLDITYQPSAKTELFRIAISDKFFYLPMRKTFVLAGDPTYFWRVPISQIQAAGLQRVKPYGLYLLSAVLLAFAVLLFMHINAVGGAVSPREYGWSGAAFVGSVLMPFAAGKRKRLVLVIPETKEKGFVWTPPLVVDAPARKLTEETLESIMRTCAQLGIPVKDL